MVKGPKKYIIPLIIFFISFFIFFFRLPSSIAFVGDFGRDLFEIAKIASGNLTLLGPKGSFGGLYTTPYYYYLFVVPFILGGKNLIGILFFNCFLFSFSISLLTFFIQKRTNSIKALLAGLTFSFMSFIISSGRQPGNGFTPIPFFLIFLATFYFFDVKKFSLWKILFSGFLFGFIVSMLFGYGVLILPIFLFVYLSLNDWKKFLLFLTGFCFAFSPLLLFELKNNFIMMKNTFIDRSYLSFVNNTNLLNGVKLNKNIFLNSLFLLQEINYWMGISLLLGILSIIISFSKKDKNLLITNIFSFVMLVILLRFQYSSHYLLPFITLLSFTLIVTVARGKYVYLLLPFIIFLLIFRLPAKLYSPVADHMNYDYIKNTVNQVISKNWLNKNDHFNVLLIRKSGVQVPVGNEYRYFFVINNYYPDGETLYSQSKKLIVFVEDKNYDIKEFNSWESREFKMKDAKIISSFISSNQTKVYLLTRQ